MFMTAEHAFMLACLRRIACYSLCHSIITHEASREVSGNIFIDRTLGGLKRLSCCYCLLSEFIKWQTASRSLGRTGACNGTIPSPCLQILSVVLFGLSDFVHGSVVRFNEHTHGGVVCSSFARQLLLHCLDSSESIILKFLVSSKSKNLKQSKSRWNEHFLVDFCVLISYRVKQCRYTISTGTGRLASYRHTSSRVKFHIGWCSGSVAAMACVHRDNRSPHSARFASEWTASCTLVRWAQQREKQRPKP